MIFFTTFVMLIRRRQGGMERRLGSPARIEGHTVRLPIGTEVKIGDYIGYSLSNGEPQMMVVIDVIHPHMPGARVVDDHVEVTCLPKGWVIDWDTVSFPVAESFSVTDASQWPTRSA